MAREGETGFKVLREIISPENVQAMAELITIKQTKCLIGYIGENAISAHEKVYIDVMHKEDESYVMSDYYDLVQDVALFLCEHYGKYLDDYLYTSKKGKSVTVKTECYYMIKRELYKRYYIKRFFLYSNHVQKFFPFTSAFLCATDQNPKRQINRVSIKMCYSLDTSAAASPPRTSTRRNATELTYKITKIGARQAGVRR